MTQHPADNLTHRDGRFYLGNEEITPARYAAIDCDWIDQAIERALAERGPCRNGELGSVV